MIVTPTKLHFDSSKLPRPWLSIIILVGSDLLALILSASIVFEVSRRLGLDINLLFDPYRQMQPALLLFLLAYFFAGLYPGFGLSAAEELRRLSYGTFLMYLVLASSTFFIRGGEEFSRGIFVLLMFLSLVLLPLFRALVREVFSKRSWWGIPVLVFGAAQTGHLIVQKLQRMPSLGLKPIAILDDDITKHSQAISNVPITGTLDSAANFLPLGVRWVLIAMPGVPRDQLNKIVQNHARGFPHVVVFPDSFGLSSLWVSAKDFSGVLGLEIRQQLLMPLPNYIKRFLDLIISMPLFIVLIPFFIFIALLIILESKGSPVFLQDRLGKSDKTFRVIKFRTMYLNSQDKLNQLLESDSQLKYEYETFAKLRFDPRVTRIGNILRKLSIDELPQLWNVLIGNMSLVGPRAYLTQEKEKMGDSIDLILRVLPGITGLWQVSGRNQLTFEQRLQLEAYYVQNWSVWLDLCILARTAWVVTFGKGAY